MKKLFLILVFPFVLCASNIDRLIEVSGIKYSVEQIPISMSKVNDKALRGRSAELVTEYQRAVTSSFDTENILSNIKLYLNDFIDSEDIDYNIRWFESDLGKKIVRLMSRNPKKVSKEELDGLKSNKKRMRLIKDIDEAMEASKSSINVALTTQRAMIENMMKTMPKHLRMPEQELNRKIEESKGYVIDSVTNQTRGLMLVNLENIGSEDLKKYLAFVKSKEGKEFFLNSNDALEVSVKKASENFGAKVAKIALKSAGIE